MQGVLAGFVTLGAIIALGFLLAQLGILRSDSQLLLSRLVFFVATPALLFQTLSRAPVAQIFTSGLAVAALSFVGAAGVYSVLARTLWHRSTGDTVIGGLSSAYVNAANLGLPITVYILGSASFVAPVLLMQLLVITPMAFAILDAVVSKRRPSVFSLISQPLRNPITVGCFLGLLVSLAGWQVPALVAAPIALIAGMAVPGVLLAYGVSLRLGPRPIAGGSVVELAVVSVLKLLVQPLLAYAAARWLFGLDGRALLAATVVAALPTAQNIFVYASRYDRATTLARDSIFVTTALSVPVLLTITALLT
ncbi:MAG TPA: AEC family transporter [Dermatophilaceae bacterium]|jgi:malonate transporter and related proteins